MLNNPIIEINTREIVDRALTRVTALSQGTLSNFSEHSPVRVLIEALVYIINEELYRVNQIPKATLVALLNSLGYTEPVGTKSSGTLEVTLTAIPEEPLSIPAGWRVSTSSGVVFTTTSSMVISGITGTAPIKSEQVGTNQNVGVGTISIVMPGQVNSPLISQVRNISATTGGTDPLEEDAAIEAGYKRIYAGKTLVTARDYEQRAEELNPGRALVVGSLGADKITYEPGSVHVFLLNADLSLPNTAQLVATQTAMSQEVFLGSLVYVSACNLIPVDLTIHATSDGSTDTLILIQNALIEYLNPLIFKGITIYYKELEHIVRNVPGVTRIDIAAIAFTPDFPETQDLILPNSYSLPLVNSIHIDLLTPTGLISLSYP